MLRNNIVYSLGPDEVEGNTCPPFDGDKSNGSDVGTESHLRDAVGFNNVKVRVGFKSAKMAAWLPR